MGPLILSLGLSCFAFLVLLPVQNQGVLCRQMVAFSLKHVTPLPRALVPVVHSEHYRLSKVETSFVMGAGVTDEISHPFIEDWARNRALGFPFFPIIYQYCWHRFIYKKKNDEVTHSSCMKREFLSPSAFYRKGIEGPRFRLLPRAPDGLSRLQASWPCPRASSVSGKGCQLLSEGIFSFVPSRYF